MISNCLALVKDKLDGIILFPITFVVIFVNGLIKRNIVYEIIQKVCKKIREFFKKFM